MNGLLRYSMGTLTFRNDNHGIFPKIKTFPPDQIAQEKNKCHKTLHTDFKYQVFEMSFVYSLIFLIFVCSICS